MNQNTYIDSTQEFTPHRQDEGWWNSLFSSDTTAETDTPFGDLNGMPRIAPKNVEKDWERVLSLYEEDQVFECQVYGFNKGGLLVQDNSLQGFVPISHLIDFPCGLPEDQRLEFLSEFVGKSIVVKVIECEQCNDRIVLSERAARSGCGTRKQVFDTLQAGNVVKGTITNMTKFGVFIDLGGVEGLVHISELSWGRVHYPIEGYSIGDIVSALVLQTCEDSCRVALSIKRLQENPWEVLARESKIGDVLPATVTSSLKFGVFAKLDNGVEGLIHHTNLANHAEALDAAKLMPGQSVEVEILQLDTERRRLGLGLVSAR